MTKKEIVKQISERIGLTQLKTKEIVQLTFDAIVATLIEEEDFRIELRNFGVFEVKLRKERKARNPRTSEKVDVPPKAVVTFKPGKEMEERVGEIPHEKIRERDERKKREKRSAEAESAATEENGIDDHADGLGAPKPKKAKKAP